MGDDGGLTGAPGRGGGGGAANAGFGTRGCVSFAARSGPRRDNGTLRGLAHQPRTPEQLAGARLAPEPVAYSAARPDQARCAARWNRRRGGTRYPGPPGPPGEGSLEPAERLGRRLSRGRSCTASGPAGAPAAAKWTQDVGQPDASKAEAGGAGLRGERLPRAGENLSRARTRRNRASRSAEQDAQERITRCRRRSRRSPGGGLRQD